jgi:uncharacterized protein involved in tolerance to divalent cations
MPIRVIPCFLSPQYMFHSSIKCVVSFESWMALLWYCSDYPQSISQSHKIQNHKILKRSYSQAHWNCYANLLRRQLSTPLAIAPVLASHYWWSSTVRSEPVSLLLTLGAAVCKHAEHEVQQYRPSENCSLHALKINPYKVGQVIEAL